MITFASDKRFGLVYTGQKDLKRNTTGRKGEIVSTVVFMIDGISCCDLSVAHIVIQGHVKRVMKFWLHKRHQIQICLKYNLRLEHSILILNIPLCFAINKTTNE